MILGKFGVDGEANIDCVMQVNDKYCPFVLCDL